MMPRGPSSSSSSSSSAPNSNVGGRSHGAPLWSRPTTTPGSANSSTSIPIARSLSGSLGIKPASSAALARKRSRMEKFGSPPPFNPSPGPSAAGTMSPESRPASSHLTHSRQLQGSDSDLMSIRPMTSQGTMSSSHRQDFTASHSTTRDRDAFSPTAAHVSHSRPSTTAGGGYAAPSSTSTSAAQQRFHPHNYHQNMPRPWTSTSSASAAAAPSSSHHHPNVMHVSSSHGHHGHTDQDMQDELDEDVIMMSVDADLLNSGPALPSSSSSSSGGPNSARQFTVPMTPRHQQQQQQHPPTPPASSSIVSRAPSFTSSYSSTHHRPHQHEPQYAPASSASPSTLNPHTHGAFPNPSHMHPPAPPPHAPLAPRMTLDQIEAMLQSHLNELTSAFSDVRDVLAQSQWYISQHKQHVQDATNAATRERDRLSGAIRAKLVESQALISDPVGAAGTAARHRAASQEQSAEQNGQNQGETSVGGRGHQAPASVSLSPRGVEGEGTGAGGNAQGTAYRDYVEQLELEEMLRSSPSPSPLNGAGGSPAKTGAAAAANANGSGEGVSM